MVGAGVGSYAGTLMLMATLIARKIIQYERDAQWNPWCRWVYGYQHIWKEASLGVEHFSGSDYRYPTRIFLKTFVCAVSFMHRHIGDLLDHNTGHCSAEYGVEGSAVDNAAVSVLVCLKCLATAASLWEL